jgi:hypothetical protein
MKNDKNGKQEADFAMIDQAMQMLVKEFNTIGMESFIFNFDQDMRKQAADQYNEESAAILAGVALIAAEAYIKARPDEDLGWVEKRDKYIILTSFGKVHVTMYEVKTKIGKVVYDTSKDFFPPLAPNDLYVSGLFAEGAEALGFPMHPNDVFDTVNRIFLPTDKKKTIKDAKEFIKIATRHKLLLNKKIAPMDYSKPLNVEGDEDFEPGEFTMPTQEQVDKVEEIMTTITDPQEREKKLTELFGRTSNLINFKKKK